MRLKMGSLTTFLTWHIFIHFDEGRGRLFSDQSIWKVLDSKRNLILAIISRSLLLGFPDVHRAQFKSLWLDQLVNTSRWRKHISGMVEHLKQTMSWVGSIVIVATYLLTFYPKIVALLM
jgi:hypothetical protein